MIKYSSTPNAFNAVRSATAAILPVYSDVGWKEIVVCFADIISTIWTSIKPGDSSTCKEVRKLLLEDITNFTQGRELQTTAMRRLIDCCSNVDYETKLQLMFSLADSPKFLMYSERELKSMADDIESHRDEINAITYYNSQGKRICPYSPAVYHDERDLSRTIEEQKGNILEFLLGNSQSESERTFYQNNFHVLKNRVMEELKVMKQKIADYKNSLYTPTELEIEWFNSVLYIQSKIENCADEMHRYMEGKADSKMFSLSESRSPISDNDHVMQVLHKLGWNKGSCPAVLSNIFYTPELKLLGIEKQNGQIEMQYEIYFSPAPGLGPMYKVRWVYSIDTNINNILTPLANLIQDADKLYDRNEAYNDQLVYLLENCPFITDAFCTDSTGYSDYLWIGIYRYIMEIYGLEPTLIDLVMKCFRIPVKIGTELITVEFGTFQGCKLLVFIMNHANRLMGIIADNLSTRKGVCIRPNAGDDVVKAVMGGRFTEEDIFLEVLVFAIFNCPTNSLKAAWLARDGYFDFCSKYFSPVNGTVKCVSGVPAKKYGKEIVCIADWAETFKVLHSSGQNHTQCYDSFEKALPVILQPLQDGCSLPNIYHIPMTINSKIEQAKFVPFTYGGLAEADEDRDLAILIETLKYKASLLLSSYTYQPMGVFLVANRLTDLQGTELFKAIGSISRQAIRDLVKLIKMLADPGAMSVEDLEWAKECIAKFERNSINGQSLSRTSSTYHRLERNRDVDLLFPIGEVSTDIGMPLPESSASALLMVSILSNQDFVDIDNMRKYIDVMKILRKYPEAIVRYYGFGNSTYFAAKDPDTGNLYRLYENDDDRYPPLVPLWYCKNKDLTRLVRILRDCHASDIVNIFYGVGDHISEGQLQWLAARLAQKQAAHVSEQYIKAILKHTLEHLDG